MAKQIKIDTVRHSLAHILAYAMQELYPGTKFGIGPAIENGFYYDFDLPSSISSENLPKIEKKMREIIKRNISFKKSKLSKSDFDRLFKNQSYKLELIKELTENSSLPVSIYKVGDFIDLCKGPHIKSTLQFHSGKAKEIIDAFKLTKIAGAYWKGDEKNPMLTRIYGIAFQTKRELQDYLHQQKEAEKRDHRKMGPKLDLFSFHEEAPGMPFWHHKGLLIFNMLVEHWRKIQSKYNYQEVKLPNILDVKLWKQSGHYEHYKDNMFFTIREKKKLALRPMDCPGTILLYKESPRSYKDLPMRIGELGIVFRNEKSGELHGLFRVQEITQDDAHIFVAKENIESEVTTLLKIVDEIYKPFSMKRKVYLSTRPDDAIGDKKTWEKAEKALKYALKKNNIKYGLKEKDGAFYGPKIDIHIDDSIGRTWQMGTIQLDFFMPERFNLEYVDNKGKKKRPVIIHRALMGSLERFIGILLEHYAGALPLWLSPVQVWVIPVGKRHEKYAKQITEKLIENRSRCALKDENETVSKKIREGEIQKIPYLLVIGDKEEKSNAVRIRERGKGDIGMMKLNKFLEKIQKK
ncbi:threonine--tRNA ligase [Candidatus Parcubacteria bacterium]|nr:threonine--tRNA ligase [Candidatus Parcubacteria bacterium]